MKGVYATKVSGQLPDEVVAVMEDEARIRYIPYVAGFFWDYGSGWVLTSFIEGMEVPRKPIRAWWMSYGGYVVGFEGNSYMARKGIFITMQGAGVLGVTNLKMDYFYQEENANGIKTTPDPPSACEMLPSI